MTILRRSAAYVVLSLISGLLWSACTVGATRPEFKLIDRSSIGGAGGWDFISFDADSKRLFISRGDRVQVWSAETGTVAAEIAGTSGVHGIALAHDLKRGFTTNGRSDSVTVFDLETLGTIATIPIVARNPDAILYDPKLKRLYTFNGGSHDMTVIDARSLQVLATIALGGKPEVAVSDSEGTVFVNIEDTAELVVVDPVADAVRFRWPLGACEEPTGLAIDRAHRRLFSVCANHQMVIVDADSGRLVGEVRIGGEPDGVEFDPGLGLAISSNGEGSLTLVHEIDAEHFSLVGNVPTQPRARTLAIDPDTHHVYLVTAAFGAVPPATAEQPRPRASMLPDTFVVLVLAPAQIGR